MLLPVLGTAADGESAPAAQHCLFPHVAGLRQCSCGWTRRKPVTTYAGGDVLVVIPEERDAGGPAGVQMLANVQLV